MITYVNREDAKLFDLAAKALGETSLSLDQYLSKLADLKAISPRYVRLPLYEDKYKDEEIFEIDANARTIKVPASFNKNGVGVVSDELAETVWFKINRYFDIKDFGKAVGHEDSNNLKDQELHILIQWEAPDGAKGASWAYAIDADTDPDYIYFGWALTAEHLTAKAGNIKFGVRIMQYDADGVAYSFATQAAVIAVKAGLSFDVTDEDIEIENVADKIASRLMGGQIAYCPVFAEDGNLDAWVLSLEVPEDAEEGAKPEARLEVVAMAPQGESYDAMAYKWYKKGLNDEDFALIDPENTDFKGQFTPALTVTSSGEYYVVVFGMRHIVDAKEMVYDADNESVSEEEFKYHTSIASSKSVVCTIPAPIKLEMDEPLLAKYLILAENPVLNIKVKRQTIQIKDEETGEKVDEPVGVIEIVAKKTASAAKIADEELENAEFVVVGEAEEGKEAVPASWSWNGQSYPSRENAENAKGDAEGDIEEHPAEEAIPATPGIKYTAQPDGSIKIEMANAEEGYYRFTVVNKLNGDQRETDAYNTKPTKDQETQPIAELVCRVVKPAAITGVSIQLAAADGNAPQEDQGSVYRRDKLKANVDVTGVLSDKLSYQWYEIVSVKDPEEAEEAQDIKIEGAVDKEYVPTHAGDYYFIATNMVVDENNSISVASDAIHFNA